MAKEGEEYMSAEELRNRLYHSLRDRGLVNSMKVVLFTVLIELFLVIWFSMQESIFCENTLKTNNTADVASRLLPQSYLLITVGELNN